MPTTLPDWMKSSDYWQMTAMNGGALASNIPSSVSFDTSDTSNIKVVVEDTPWGTLSSSSVTAAASSTAAVTTVTGSTSSGQPFHIDHADGILQCYLDDASSHRHWLAGGSGVIAGTLLGAAVGFAARSPVVGGVAALIASTTSLLVAHFVAENTGQVQSGGSTPTWVANDGGSNLPKSGPQAVTPVRATA